MGRVHRRPQQEVGEICGLDAPRLVQGPWNSGACPMSTQCCRTKPAPGNRHSRLNGEFEMMPSSGLDSFVAAARAGGNAEIHFDPDSGRLRFNRSSNLKNAAGWLTNKLGMARAVNTRTIATYDRFLDVLAGDRRGAAHLQWAIGTLAGDRVANKPLTSHRVRQILTEIDRRNADTDPEAGRLLPGAGSASASGFDRTSRTAVSISSSSSEPIDENGATGGSEADDLPLLNP